MLVYSMKRGRSSHEPRPNSTDLDVAYLRKYLTLHIVSLATKLYVSILFYNVIECDIKQGKSCR